MTLVGRTDDHYFEHRLSWYAAPKRLALTFGHPASIGRDPLGLRNDLPLLPLPCNGS